MARVRAKKNRQPLRGERPSRSIGAGEGSRAHCGACTAKSGGATKLSLMAPEEGQAGKCVPPKSVSHRAHSVAELQPKQRLNHRGHRGHGEKANNAFSVALCGLCGEAFFSLPKPRTSTLLS